MVDIPALIAATGGAVSAFVAAFSFGQRQRALRAETDVRLAQAFAELVPIANARAPGLLSDAAAGRIAEKEFASNDERNDALRGAVITPPVGSQTQVAVLRAVASLGCEHALLWQAARAAVETATVTTQVESQRLAALKELSEHEPSAKRKLGCR